MPLFIVRQDITRMQVDAIVNAANGTLLGGGGVDGAIHRAAGPGLLEECRTLGGCATGQAKLTKGYRLPAKYVIHTVGPVWHGGGAEEEALLRSCYRESLRIARENGLSSAAFPLISAGHYGYPREEALRIAGEELERALADWDADLYLTVFDKGSYRAAGKKYPDIARYIDDRYVDGHLILRRKPMTGAAYDPYEEADFCAAPSAPMMSLEDALESIDESFSEMVLRKIDEKGIKDSVCYRRANIDRKLFSKIRSDREYRPGKRTALALAVALELPLPEAEDLLRKAGFALSHSNRFDIILEYCINSKLYDVHEINRILFEFDQPLLGA